MSDPKLAALTSNSVGWIVPNTERPRAPVRNPAFAGPLPSVIHAYKTVPIANAAIVAAINPTPTRTKRPPSLTIDVVPTPGTTSPQTSAYTQHGKCGKVGAIVRHHACSRN